MEGDEDPNKEERVMSNQQAIAIMSNSLFTLENTNKYKEDNGIGVPITDYMLTEAMRAVLDLAKRNNTTKIVDDIIKMEEK